MTIGRVILLPPKDLGPMSFFSLGTWHWGLARAMSAGVQQPASWECGEGAKECQALAVAPWSVGLVLPLTDSCLARTPGPRLPPLP